MSEEEVEDEKFLEMVKKKQEDQREKNKSEFGEDGETSRYRLCVIVCVFVVLSSMLCSGFSTKVYAKDCMCAS